ncbi:Cytosine deaminase/metal-dependent hydrolase [Gaiella occulta]|uniref:Cytosine deaminase/metal-dependent hydrolase n=1 Tax=Gaiella occulta TaxID=1002870 RepID=A0A7M2YZF6_9ACTN|nr:amidohydrolase family protein [Gaiella occulta]RDI75527.1 Cytosine deaminase/metal-dependent hydrolase [Gaiella occulta]
MDEVGPVALAGAEGAFTLGLEDGRIASVTPAVGAPLRLALPALADLHVHADRAFARGPRPPRSLADAVELVREIKLASSEDDVRERATRLFARALAHGTLRMRTHVDIDKLIGERGLGGVLAAREAVAGRIDVEIVAFATKFADPTTPDGEARLRAAVGAGADLLGGVPALHADPVASVERVLDLAAELGLAADLHVDEASTPEPFVLEALADATLARGLEGRVTASHTCALAAVDDATARRTIAKLAEARITVIALPALNLFLQGRGDATPRVRGLTLVRELAAAGVEVRFASDNVRDVFYPYGDADPLEAAWLAALSAHVDDEDVLLAGVCGGRTRLRAGDAADVVLLDAPSFQDALSIRPAGRTVLRAGAIESGPGQGGHP